MGRLEERGEGRRLGLPTAERPLMLLHHGGKEGRDKAGARVAAASATMEPMGFCLCGMVDEPPRPWPDGSAASPISACDNKARSRAILPIVPVRMPSALPRPAMASRRVCQGMGASARPRREARRFATSTPWSPSADNVPAAPPS